MSGLRGRLLRLDGHLESVIDRTAWGWVWSPDAPAGTLVVSAWCNGRAVGLARADRYRADLARSGKREGRCAFALPIGLNAVGESWWRSGRLELFVQHLVRGRLGVPHRWLGLDGDALNALCERLPREAANAAPPAGWIGAIDRIDQRKIAGWCLATEGRTATLPLHVHLYVDDVWRASVEARASGWAGRLLRHAGPEGHARFAFPVPKGLSDGLGHTLTVTAASCEDVIDGPIGVRLRASEQGLGFAPPPLAASVPPAAVVTDGPRRGEYETWMKTCRFVSRTKIAAETHAADAALLVQPRSGRAGDARRAEATASAVRRTGGSETLRAVTVPFGRRGLRDAVAAAHTRWIAVTDAGARPAPDFGPLLIEGAALGEREAADLVTFDDDEIHGGIRRTPRFKTVLCPDRMLTDNPFGGCTLVRTAAARAAFASAPEPLDAQTLCLKVARRSVARRACHVPGVAVHRAGGPVDPGSRWSFVEALLTAEAHAGGHEPPTLLPCAAAPLGQVSRPTDRPRIVWPLPKSLPLTSIIIPTKDHADLFEPLVRDILASIAEPAEIVLVDNASSEPATADAFRRLARDPRVRFAAYPDPFNFSAANNVAARQARGDVLVFVNNDVARPRAGLLTELLRQVLRPDVGVVGARLAYANGSNQHCGIALGIGGVASNLLRGHTDLFRADHGRFRHVQTVSAVTAALMAVRRTTFEAVGGFEESLPLAYNDVDFCLRVTALTGLRVVYTPHAVAYHLESQSRGRDDTPDKRVRLANEKAIMQARWGDALLADPYFSRNHSLDSRDLRPAERTRGPAVSAAAVAAQ